ncbi:hypothetical protein A4R26_07315 [Niastella populi]|uniref:Uncharacterized protein n=1 Tax=Niastella populi TaxID=550983 RepID=A0A1V9ESR9_9BACT|nr:hypothetical protein A4R26_07315 [Niastella populi]
MLKVLPFFMKQVAKIHSSFKWQNTGQILICHISKKAFNPRFPNEKRKNYDPATGKTSSK